jgi:hypothetical protein
MKNLYRSAFALLTAAVLFGATLAPAEAGHYGHRRGGNGGALAGALAVGVMTGLIASNVQTRASTNSYAYAGGYGNTGYYPANGYGYQAAPVYQTQAYGAPIIVQRRPVIVEEYYVPPRRIHRHRHWKRDQYSNRNRPGNYVQRNNYGNTKCVYSPTQTGRC